MPSSDPDADGAPDTSAGATPIYDGDPSDGTGGRAIAKRGAQMHRAVYRPVHRNDAFPDGDARAGRGEAAATWVFSEQAGTAEGLLASSIDLVHDTHLAPDAAIGLHTHETTEEIYYILDGALTMTTVFADGGTHTATLGPGDAHALRAGQAHSGVAGPDGCRMIVVCARVG